MGNKNKHNNNAKKESLSITGLLRSSDYVSSNESVGTVIEVETLEAVEPVVMSEEETTVMIPISVHFTEVEAVNVAEIRDEHGRLSDMLDAIGEELDVTVLPLHMCNIAPEVTMLQRHEIFELGGVRYSMTDKIRRKEVDNYKQRILRSLKMGLPYEETLVSSVTYNNKDYSIISLSRAEWTLLLSMFRNYKQSLFINGENKIVMRVLAERV